ncbi:hypothetical protein [Azospirillum canadense]|uniref:hypothetical protein n=1 Tax=Azospirillum canadense TaxID=403962 RepID=UPI0022273732|nr:hypothetical protein [Azospirillum canadense]MCW2242319.1 hypothetical protein [Azospirillum canadense]
MAERFEMRCDEAFAARIDEWRAARRPIPNRSAAVRHLVEMGLCYDEEAVPLLRKLLEGRRDLEVLRQEYPDLINDVLGPKR